MNRPRWRKVVSDLWDNKARTLLVIASIAIGVFAVGMIVGSYVIIDTAMTASYVGANPANIRMITTDFDDDFLEGVQQAEGVAEAEGQRRFSVRVRIGEAEWKPLELVALAGFADQRVNRSQAPLGPVVGFTKRRDQPLPQFGNGPFRHPANGMLAVGAKAGDEEPPQAFGRDMARGHFPKRLDAPFQIIAFPGTGNRVG